MPEFTVVWLRSILTGKRFPIAVLFGDTDMVTHGWATLTSEDREEVAIVRVLPGESGAAVAERVNERLDRRDLRAVALISVEEPTTPEGSSFQEFRKTYKRPVLRYSDIYSAGEAEVVEEVERQVFERNGGRVLELP